MSCMDPGDPLHVVIAEDDALLRAGLIGLIARVADITLVGEASDLPTLQAAVDDLRPDVVVTDIRMPPTGTDEGIVAATWMAEHHPTIGVVVLSNHVNPQYAMALLSSGTGRRAYLLKDRVGDIDELAAAIRTVGGGGSVLDPAVVDALVSASQTKPRSPIDQLTARETEVLAEMAQGRSNAAIASSLVLSERAIEKHSSSIFMKLGLSEEKDLNRRVSAVLIYLGAGNPTR